MNSKYDKAQVAWMEKELENIGIKPLTTENDVDKFMAETKGTAMVMVNSVCGCAAGAARPGVGMALQNELIPDRMATVFAGVNVEATAKARSYMDQVPPSSPSVALFKDGELVHFVPRSEIEGFNYDEIAAKLADAFDQHCSSKGPSVPMEKLEKAFDRSNIKIS